MNLLIAHQVIENTTVVTNDEGEEVEEHEKRAMDENEFGSSRRIHSGTKPQNAFCSECGESLWSKKVPTRYNSFKEWAQHEKELVHAIKQENKRLVRQVQDSQKDTKKIVGMPKKIAAIEYIRRRMNNFFDISIVDEVHELKGGATAQGNSLGSLAAVSKKIVAGTGTLFGGKAEDVYYLLWRLFPQDMVNSGYKFHEVRRFNEEFGNIETTIYEQSSDSTEYSNSNSRGGTKRTEKVMPGISPFIYGRYMVHNVVNMKLKDVWPDPVPLIDTPTIFVDMDEDLRKSYRTMINTFESNIKSRDDGHKLYLPMTDYGVSYPDNPYTFPDATIKNVDGDRELIWEADHLEKKLRPKEKKLQEIIKSEMAEGRKSIVYVRDTGSSNPGRDVRPRLQEVLEEAGAKVCILDTSTVATNKRSDWLEKKITKEGYDVCICSQELVKVGLDLIHTPTLIFYQFSWSLFTINQAARRAWRISQTSECRLFYLAYRDSYQETMAKLIAQKNRATAAINGEVSSDGLSAMLGDEGDLQSMLINTVKKGNKVLKGSTEDWVSQHSDRAREILDNIGKDKPKSVPEQFQDWVQSTIDVQPTKNVLLNQQSHIVANIQKGLIPGFRVQGNVLEIDLVEAFGLEDASDGIVLSHLTKPQQAKEYDLDNDIFVVEQSSTRKRRKKQEPVDGQCAFQLF